MAIALHMMLTNIQINYRVQLGFVV